MMATTSMVVVQSSARSAMIRRGLVAHSLNPPTRCFQPRALVRHFSAHTSSSGQELVATSITTQFHNAPTSSVSLLHHHNYNRSLSSSTLSPTSSSPPHLPPPPTTAAATHSIIIILHYSSIGISNSYPTVSYDTSTLRTKQTEQ